MRISEWVTNQNLSRACALIFSRGFSPVVRASSCFTSGLSQTSSAVSGINVDSSAARPAVAPDTSLRLHPGAQDFSDAPGLGDAAAGHVRFASVEHVADRAEAVVAQMSLENFEKFSRGRFVVWMNFQPGVDEWADEPGPNRALVISAVARAQVARVNRFVVGVIGGKRTQPERREQFFLDKIDN